MLQAAVPMYMALQGLRRHTVSASAAPARQKKTPPTGVGGVQGRTTCLRTSTVATPGLGAGGVTRCATAARRGPRWRRAGPAPASTEEDVDAGMAVFDALDPPRARTSRPKSWDVGLAGGS